MEWHFGYDLLKVFSMFDVFGEKMNVLLFLFGDFFFNIDSFLLLFLALNLLGFHFGFFFFFLHSLLVNFSDLLHFLAPCSFFFNNFAHFSFMLLFCQNI